MPICGAIGPRVRQRCWKNSELDRAPGRAQTRKQCTMRSAKPPETGCVILFRPRQAGSRQRAKVQPARGAVGLRKPRSAREDDDDHRRRRLIHALGLAYCLILAVAGVWLADEFTEMKAHPGLCVVRTQPLHFDPHCGS